MKRNMDLLRELMLKLEVLPVPTTTFRMIHGHEDEVRIDGYTVEEIDYHLSLLDQAGFIHAGGLDFGMGIDIGGTAFRGLTWAGHDFIDSVRSKDVWDQTKVAAAKVGGFTVDILVTAAKAYVQRKFTEFLSGPH
ncbi:hypothetical protein B7G54_24295 [Burkholderia puraquae]|uniref:DUF2513 domain-containing protein n=1 Tax=Burkholderia puraquae TaxID=1904757 RepID=A0A1X1PCR7_9BURK|nr:DUF2513 domain-containing protein [Burkholderia puraquae]ORT83443.1 hypothetical protein B7G54_24295 [Burkholderia puraquae]CAB3762825.1 hypothetical protein LMG29660_04582 [Burkholderia puraquae]